MLFISIQGANHTILEKLRAYVVLTQTLRNSSFHTCHVVTLPGSNNGCAVSVIIYSELTDASYYRADDGSGNCKKVTVINIQSHKLTSDQ